ncbi:MAG: hypothetical protein EXR07_12630 [Acetobacteraceae bacterium]|nr:hypothetical protein [Acetobacteraceae bacterium]
MFDAIRTLRPEQAAGIMADMALWLDSHAGTRPARPLIDDQERVEATLLREVQEFLHLDPLDFSAPAVEQLTRLLDTQTDDILATLAHPDAERLSALGLLPSDVYQIAFGQNLVDDFKWRWPLESQLATKTVRSPHKQQVLGVGERNFPALTIFGRFFQHHFPARSFWMIVIGQRTGLTLEVTQVWRAYPSQLDLVACETLLDVLKAIADAYGHSVSMDGKSGKFFWKVPRKQISEINLVGSNKDIVTLSRFESTVPEGVVAVLVVPMNLTQYFKYVENWRGWDSDIMSQLGVAASGGLTTPSESLSI